MQQCITRRVVSATIPKARRAQRKLRADLKSTQKIRENWVRALRQGICGCRWILSQGREKRNACATERACAHHHTRSCPKGTSTTVHSKHTEKDRARHPQAPQSGPAVSSTSCLNKGTMIGGAVCLDSGTTVG